MKKFCKKCQAETERNKYGKCYPCRREIALKWRNANLEAARAITARWTEENKDRARAAVARWAEANKDRKKATNSARYKRKKDELSAKRAVYRAANRERISEQNAAYYRANPDKARANWANRRARMRQAIGSHTGEDIAQLFRLQLGKCVYCKTSIEDKYHVDHIIPLAAGGSNDRTNIQLLCPPCNLSKGAKHPIEFMRQRGYLP